MALGLKFSSFRTEVDKKTIEKLAGSSAVLRLLEPTGDRIVKDVRARTSRSTTVRPFGRKMSLGEADGKLRVGTDWGPAVPVEYGSADTPAQRILLGAAEKNGRVEF